MTDREGAAVMWAVTVDLRSFALAVADRGRTFAKWTREVRELARAAQRYPRTARLAKIVDDNLLNEDGLATIDQLVEFVALP